MPNSDAIQQIRQVIANIPYLADLDPSLFESIAGELKLQEHEAGQVVFLEGEQDVAVFIIQSGWLKAVKTSPDGREHILHFVGPGEVFNLTSVFTQSPNPATVIALEPSSVWVMPQAVILRLLDQHPQLGRAIIHRLAERVEQLIHMVEDLSLRTIEARLARYLLAESQNEQMARPRWATQAELANRLGTVPDVLHRALRNLSKENLIRVERQHIHILDLAALEARAQVDK